MQELRIRAAATGAFLCCSLTACGTIPQGYDRGENLRLPAQILRWPEQARDDPFLPGLQPGKAWRVNRSRHEKTEYSAWSVTNRSDRLSILVMRDGPGPSPEDYLRREAEAGGQADCLTETSFDTLGSTSVGGFARVLRLTTCTLNDLLERPGDDHQNRENLLLYIQGRDAHYVLMRTWRIQPTDAEFRQWEDYFSRVAICDTRWFRGPRCPLEETVAP